MANSNKPYKRDGDDNAWNDLISKINELADECGLEPLEKVKECHRWSKQDIKDAQDKLKEICDENEFSDVEDLWLKDIVQELEDAIEKGACCDCDAQDNLAVIASYAVNTLGINGTARGTKFLGEESDHPLSPSTFDIQPLLNAAALITTKGSPSVWVWTFWPDTGSHRDLAVGNIEPTSGVLLPPFSGDTTSEISTPGVGHLFQAFRNKDGAIEIVICFPDPMNPGGFIQEVIPVPG